MMASWGGHGVLQFTYKPIEVCGEQEVAVADEEDRQSRRHQCADLDVPGFFFHSCPRQKIVYQI